MKPAWWSLVEPEAHTVVEGFTKKLRNKLSDPPEKIVARKNPFLFRVRVERDGYEFARMVTDAYLSSSEETMFGNVLERIAISICKHAKCGWKSTAEKIDLEYEQGDMRCIVQIKSGVNWGNSSQKASMGSSFKKAATIVRQGNPNIHVKCIEGICYGASEIKDCGSHHRYIGHAFWKEISDWDGTADAVLELIGTHASNGLNEARAEACARIVSYLRSSGVVDEQEFSQDPEQAAPLECKIRWDKLLALVLS